MEDLRRLRAELEARGYSVASGTLSLRGELYIRGDRDPARALFEFSATAEEAFATMYQDVGGWHAATFRGSTHVGGG